MKTVNITKASGEIAPFSSDKLRQSLKRSGAGDDTINIIISEIKNQLYEGITTNKIYKNAFGMLKNISKHHAAKYKLKQAIMELGPSGFPFEKYIADILNYQGFQVKTGEIVKGDCVNHEVDVLAEKDNKRFMIECKYHNLAGINCDVKVPLYIQSRFLDIVKEWNKLPGHESKTYQGWVVTNTKFTGDAIQYGKCVGLYLLGWDFPVNGSLREQIDQSGLYPITCLTTLSSSEKEILLNNKIVLCRDLNKNSDKLSFAHISDKRKKVILTEAFDLCRD